MSYLGRLSNSARSIYWLTLLPGLLLSSSCGLLPPGDAQSESSPSPSQAKLVAVDGAIARLGTLKEDPEYIGTTFPVREVSLRSRIEGQILDIVVDAGERVQQGQVLARIDDSILDSVVLEEKAELAALQSEVASLEADINDLGAQVTQAKVELKQAQSNAERSSKLFQQGAVGEQVAELDRTALGRAKQVLQSTQEQVKNRSSAVIAAQRRVAAQEALVTQSEKRKSFAVLTSPITGSVLEKSLESGDLAQPGDEVLQLGDFSQIQLQVQVSELALGQIRVGQKAQVKLDAFPTRTFTGSVTQISLAADTTARLIPVEVTIPNRDRQISKGLLGRVSFLQESDRQIVVPETAVQIGSSYVKDNTDEGIATMYILNRVGEQTRVATREVQIGDRANAIVEILSGLAPGEEYVVRSSGDLQDGATVRLSFISESGE